MVLFALSPAPVTGQRSPGDREIDLPAAVAARPERQFLGGGSWKSQLGADERRDWSVQLKRSGDGAIAGRLAVRGGPKLGAARLEGRIDGDDVYGVLLDDADAQIGRFNGRIVNAGKLTAAMAGTYTLADGDRGDWQWEGPLPE